jgi:hypothetical protein
MAPGRFRRLAASIAIAGLVWYLSVPLTPAESFASWSGRVFEADRATPREGVVVSLDDGQSERAVRSTPTRKDGAFNIDEAPAGTYRLAVETSEGVFLSSEPVELRAGPNPPMALTLSPASTHASQQQGFGSGNGFSRRTEYLIAGAVGLTALFVISEVIDDDSESAPSVYQPTE